MFGLDSRGKGKGLGRTGGGGFAEVRRDSSELRRKKMKKLEEIVGEIVDWSILTGGIVFLFFSILRRLAAL